MARVLIGDDNAAFRSIAGRLVREQGHVVAGEAEDAVGTLRLARALAPDVVLLDVHLGTSDGWTVARTLSRLHPRPRVVMVSSDPDTGSPALLRASRAERFVPKDELASHDLGAL
jgi:two-component system response regulator EvgA